MKTVKSSLLLILVLTASSINAQVSFGVKGGINSSNINTKSNQGNGVSVNLETKNKIAFNIGMFAEYMLNKNIGFQSGLNYSARGYRDAKITATDQNGNILDMKVDINMGVIQIPLHLAYKIGIGSDVNLVLHAGPYLGYIITAKSKTTVNDALTVETDLLDKELQKKLGGSMDRLDAGLGFGFGFEFKNFITDFGLDLGLKSISGKHDMVKEKMQQLYFSVGYKF